MFVYFSNLDEDHSNFIAKHIKQVHSKGSYFPRQVY